MNRRPRTLQSVLLATLAAVGLTSMPLAGNADAAPRFTRLEPTEDMSPDSVDGPLARDRGKTHVLVELRRPAAAVAFGQSLRRTASKGAAVSAARQQVNAVRQEQRDFSSALSGSGIQVKEVYRVQKVANGVALAVDRKDIARLKRLPQVAKVTELQPEFPHNSKSVPFLGTETVWQGIAGLPATGAGIRIGIIDSGIDYLHATFGGNGLIADYVSNDRTTIADGFFPTPKVVGGWDFVGDNYDGYNAAQPDPDPMDCHGHGSHVAGTAGGLGVNEDGTPFAGPWDGSVPFSSLRIGPGTAPQASLYALRVFGCTGSTNFTVPALEWAMDPDGDDDLSDHLDVVNLSLGSAYGHLSEASAIAADNAAAAGVVVVASAGNNGDTYFITGTPGTGARVISTAASTVASDQPLITVNNPSDPSSPYQAAGAGFGPLVPSSGITGDVVLAEDTADWAGPSTTDACSPLTNAGAVAGKIALVDRGACNFPIKVKNAQDAGAVAVVIANNVGGAAFSPGGSDPTIIIPSMMVDLGTGNAFKTNLPGLNVTLQPAQVPNADVIASFSSRGPRGPAGANGLLGLKPDITAPGVGTRSAQTGVQWVEGTIVYAPNSHSVSMSGTSMASPHVAGIAALVRQLRPDWSVEEIKAALMNGALHDITTLPGGGGNRYGPGRVGAGRVDPVLSASLEVLAFNADDEGQVSLAFDSTPVLEPTVRTKRLRMVNHGDSPATFDLGIDTVVDAPGLAFLLPGGNTVTIPAQDQVELDVHLSADPTQMRHTRDITVSPANARHWLTEEAGYLTLSQSGDTKLRVPLYVATSPASAMSTAGTLTEGTTALPLSGTGVCTGTLGANVDGPTCSGAFPLDEVSLVSPLEWQVSSPQAAPDTIPPHADLQYAGVGFDPNLAGPTLFFGISTWGNWGSPNSVGINIYIDCGVYSAGTGLCENAPDGEPDYVVLNTMLSANRDTYATVVVNLHTGWETLSHYLNGDPASVVDTRPVNNQVMLLPVAANLVQVHGPFRYAIRTCDGAYLCISDFLDEGVGVNPDGTPNPGITSFYWDPYSQGVDFGGNVLAMDLDGSNLPVIINATNMALNGSVGALLLHHHNLPGERAEVVLASVEADLATTVTITPATPVVLAPVTVTVGLTNNGPSDGSSVGVSISLPAGFVYTSDDMGGSFDTATGIWTVGAMAASGTTSLNIYGHLQTTGLTCFQATATGSPFDPDSSNNSGNACVTAIPAPVALTASKTVSGDFREYGLVTYTVSITNQGTGTLADNAGHELTDVLPSEVNLVSANAASGLASADIPTKTVHWNGSLAANASTTLTIVARVNPGTAGQTVSNQATLSFDADANGTNEAAGVSDDPSLPGTADPTSFVALPGLPVNALMSVSGSFIEGGLITYTVVITNGGPASQGDNPGDELVSPLPPQLELQSATATSGTASASGGGVTWNGSIPSGGSVTITITARVRVGTAGQVVSSQATVHFDIDGNGTNETVAVSDDPAQPGSTDATRFTIAALAGAPVPVPLFGWPALLLLLFGLSGITAFHRRRK